MSLDTVRSKWYDQGFQKTNFTKSIAFNLFARIYYLAGSFDNHYKHASARIDSDSSHPIVSDPRILGNSNKISPYSFRRVSVRNRYSENLVSRKLSEAETPAQSAFRLMLLRIVEGISRQVNKQLRMT